MATGYFAGLDVGLHKTAICVVDEAGRQLLAVEVASEAAVMDKLLRRFTDAPLKLGLETGQLSIHLTRSLRALGYDAVCMDARQVAVALSTVVNKTDANDARGIAHLLRCGLYREVHIKSEEAVDRRVLLASRKQVLTQVAALESSIRGLCKLYGVCLGPARRSGFIPRIREAMVQMGALAQAGLSGQLSALEALRASLKQMDSVLQEQVQADERAALLMSMPGIGVLNATSLLATLDEAERFTDSRQVGAYLGLTPRQYSSGETQRRGRISRCGPAHARALLYEAAHCLLHFYKGESQLKKWGKRLAKKKGMQRAIVAVARRMAVILHRMLVTGQPYDDSRLKVA
jgi:transposase